MQRSKGLHKEHTSVQLHVPVLRAVCIMEVVHIAAVVCPFFTLTFI